MVPTLQPIDPEVSRALGARIRELRITRKKPQEQIAHAAGISRNHLQNIERGVNDRTSGTPWNPHLSTLLVISDALEVSLSELTADIFQPPGDPVVEAADLHH